MVNEKARDGELSLSVCPGVVNRLPNKEKIAGWQNITIHGGRDEGKEEHLMWSEFS